MDRNIRKILLRKLKKEIVAKREKLRLESNKIDVELNYMKGHYDLSWEDRYLVRLTEERGNQDG